MAVTLVQKTALGTFGTTTCSAPAWTQNTAAGNLLVAVVWGVDTAAHISAFAENSGAWTKLVTIDNTGASPVGSTGQAAVALFTLAALGSDAAPSFTMTAGGGGTKSCNCVVYELSGADMSAFASSSYLDTSGVWGSGASTATLTTMGPATTSAAPSATGGYAIGAFAQERSATTVTWTDSASPVFTADVAGNGASNICGPYAGHLAGPATTGTVSDSGHFSTNSTALGAGLVVVFKAASVSTPKSSADTGTGTGAAVSVKVSGADSASGVGIPSPVRISSADSAHGAEAALDFEGEVAFAVESASVSQGNIPKSSADTGHGTDAVLSAGPAQLVFLAGLSRAGSAAYIGAGPVPAGGTARSSSDLGHTAEGCTVRVAGSDAGHGTEAASGQASLSSSDSGHGTAGTPSVRVTGADSGHGAEAGSVHAALSTADTGHGAQGSPSVRISGTGTGHGAEGSGLSATLAGPDTGHVAETFKVKASAAEAGHGLESVSSLHATVPGTGTGQGAETAQIKLSGGDTARGAEGSPSGNGVHASLSAAEVGHGTEYGALPGSPSGSDAGHWLEAGSVHVTLSGTDSGHGTEAGSVNQGSTPKSSADAGHGTETASVRATLAGTSTGHGTEAASVHAIMAGPDTGHGLDAGSVTEGSSSAEAGHGIDAGSVRATLPGADSGHAAEQGSSSGGTSAISSADHGLATESAFYYISSADTGQGTGAPGSVRTSSRDTARGAEQPLNAWPSSRDTGKGKDFPASAWPEGDDVGRGAEAYRPFRFAGADSGVSFEVLHEMGIWTYLPVGVRLAGRFWRVTGLDEDGNEVVILEAEHLTGDMLELAERVNGPLEEPGELVPQPIPGVFGMPGTGEDPRRPAPAAVRAPAPWPRGRKTVKKLSSGDRACAGEQVAAEPVGVTCWVQPAVDVSVTVTEAAS